MAVSGFSVEQDAEYQMYRQLRIQYLAQEKSRKEAERISQGLPPKRSTGELMRDLLAMRKRKSVSVRGNVVASWKLEDDSEWEGV